MLMRRGPCRWSLFTEATAPPRSSGLAPQISATKQSLWLLQFLLLSREMMGMTVRFRVETEIQTAVRSLCDAGHVWGADPPSGAALRVG